ncbi:MAG: response regulator [Lachnospiraceae bacterium]|nr:response regulator [Lachnospiraceae bacterium]
MMIGEIIKKYRLERKLTQEEMAEALHITPQAVSRWETGISYPDVTMLPKLAKYLHISTDKLLGCENNEIIEHQEILNQSQIDSIFDYIPGKKTPGRKVLVVDDAEFMRNILTDILSTEGHNVLQAKNGLECIDILKKETVDICILDLNMPVMNGMETLEKIRESYPSLKIIILSVESTEENVRKTLLLGANGFVAKPFQQNSILERMC